MSKKEISIKLSHVSKTFRTHSRSMQTLKDRFFNFYKKKESKNIIALNDINLEIYKGECIGIIGNNGSGKSTLTKIMSGAYLPDKGGTVTKIGTSLLLNLGVGFSHELTARENIYVNASTLGLRKKDIDEKLHDIIDFAELKEFIDTKVKYFSSGMIKRLSFSIALYAESDILFLDEVFAVGDSSFKKKATKMLEKNWIEGRTAIIVSHSIGLIKKYCERTILIDKGKLKYFGETTTAIKLYESL